MKKALKRTAKVAGIAVGSFLAFALLYFAVAYCLSRVTVNKTPEAGDYATIYIMTNGAHTDIVVPVESDVVDWRDFVSTDHTLSKDPSVNYVAFGWGDKGFYMDTPTWADLRFSVAFRAAFALSTSAMHVTFYRHIREDDMCRSIMVSRAQYEALAGYIIDRFRRDEQGRSVLIETDAQYGEYDAFYEARGRYNLFFTCNTWANSALKACGQKAAAWTIFDTGIFHHY